MANLSKGGRYGLAIRTKTGEVLIEDWLDLIRPGEAVLMSGLGKRQFDRLVERGWAPQPIELCDCKVFVKWEIKGWSYARQLRKIRPILQKMKMDKGEVYELLNQRFTEACLQLSFFERQFIDDPALSSSPNSKGVYFYKRDHVSKEEYQEEHLDEYVNECISLIKANKEYRTGSSV